MGNSTDVDGNTVTLSALGEVVRAAGGSNTVALRDLLKHAQQKAVEKVSRTTVAQRKDALARALAGQDDEQLIEIDAIAREIVEEIISNEIDPEGGVLDEAKAKSLMAEHLHRRTLSEALDARKAICREAVFSHMDHVLLAQGVLDPQNHNAVLEVPALGFKFCREGAGYKDPQVDQATLRAMLGEQRWAQVADEKVIPEHVELELNETKLLDLANADPQVMDVLAQCLKPGGEKTPRLNTREM